MDIQKENCSSSRFQGRETVIDQVSVIVIVICNRLMPRTLIIMVKYNALNLFKFSGHPHLIKSEQNSIIMPMLRLIINPKTGFLWCVSHNSHSKRQNLKRESEGE